MSKFKYTVADLIRDLGALPPGAELFSVADSGTERRVVSPDDLLFLFQSQGGLTRVYVRDMTVVRRRLEKNGSIAKQVQT